MFITTQDKQNFVDTSSFYRIQNHPAGIYGFTRWGDKVFIASYVDKKRQGEIFDHLVAQSRDSRYDGNFMIMPEYDGPVEYVNGGGD